MADVHECSKLKVNFLREKNKSIAKRKKLLSSNYIIKKRQPFDTEKKRDKDIFITNKTNFKAQLKKCEKFLNNGNFEVIIHGLGSAIQKACSLALQLKEIHYGGIELDIKTSTIPIIDDFEPLDDNADYETINRNNSAIHIRVYRKFSIVHWLGLTIFEIWINLVSLTIFTVLLALKLDDNYFLGHTGWWIVFSPLFVADGLNTYFCAIIFIRMHLEGMTKAAILRALWSIILLLLIFVFKYLLCKKLSGQSPLEYSEVLSPIFILLQLIAVRACQLH